MGKFIDSITAKTLTKGLIASEKAIRAGQASYLVIGKELKNINDNELFKERGFDTWTSYINCMFDMNRDYSYKLINAYMIHTMLLEAGYKGQSLPKTESQSRPLVSMFKDFNKEIVPTWHKIIADTDKLTAKLVQTYVNKAIGKQTPEKKPGKADTSDNPLDILLDDDKTGIIAKDNTKPDTATLEAQLSELKAQNSSLEAELIKARKIKASVPRNKMAIELYKAGFKVLAQSTTPKQMDKLIALKDSLIG